MTSALFTAQLASTGREPSSRRTSLTAGRLVGSSIALCTLMACGAPAEESAGPGQGSSPATMSAAPAADVAANPLANAVAPGGMASGSQAPVAANPGGETPMQAAPQGVDEETERQLDLVRKAQAEREAAEAQEPEGEPASPQAALPPVEMQASEEEEAQRLAEEEAQLQEAEAQRLAEEEAMRQEEESMRLAEEEAQQQEEEAKRLAEEQAKRDEEEAKRQEEEEAKRQEEEQAKREEEAASQNNGDVGPKKCGCESDSGEFGQVEKTIVVKGSYDGKCQVFRGNKLGDGSQGEEQDPIFRLEKGATLKNVIIDKSGTDGIHIYGDSKLENVHWRDVGEDAMTVKAKASVTLDCGSAQKADDKIFQVNQPAKVTIKNFTARSGGKFIRQTGGSTWKMELFIDHCDISGMKEAVFRTDSSSSQVTITNSIVSKGGKGLFIFGEKVVNGESNQSTLSNNKLN